MTKRIVVMTIVDIDGLMPIARLIKSLLVKNVRIDE